MNYKGTIIEESLQDTSVLKEVKIIKTKVEKVTKNHQTPWLKQWTLHSVEIDEQNGQDVAEKISKVINSDPCAWYADFKNDKFHYIIYPNKIFKIDLSNPHLYKDAKDYGLSLEIPKYQLDFTPEDKVWER